MHKHPIRLAAVLALLALAGAAIAGTVYDRTSGTVSKSTASCTITPPAKYAGVVLKKVWASGAGVTNCNLTVYRVIESGTVNQEVCTVACGAATSGSGVPAQYAALKSGEYFFVTNSVTTNMTVYVDYEVQTHD